MSDSRSAAAERAHHDLTAGHSGRTGACAADYDPVMSSEVAAAVIASAVSFSVAIATVLVTIVTTRHTLRRDQERQRAEFDRHMTMRLYERRMEVYPGLFAATGSFRRSRLQAADDPMKLIAEGLVRIDEWHENAGGLLLSPEAYDRFLELRRTARASIDKLRNLSGDGNRPDREGIVDGVWQRKNELRDKMRQDLRLLFSEVEPGDTAPGGTPTAATHGRGDDRRGAGTMDG